MLDNALFRPGRRARQQHLGVHTPDMRTAAEHFKENLCGKFCVVPGTPNMRTAAGTL